MNRPSGDTAVAFAVSALLIVSMAIDHLIGTDDDPGEESGLADPGAFALSVLLSLALLALLFRFVVRGAQEPDAAARRAMVCSALAVPAVVIAFLGIPYAFAGAGIAMGLRGRAGGRRRLATAAVALGTVVIAAITVGYAVALIA